MGLYTKKVKDETVVKEVKKKGRPKKVVDPVEPEVEVEQPKQEEPASVEPEPPKQEEIKVQPIPVEKTPPPPETVEEPLKKATLKKKVVEKKVEKKVAPPKTPKPKEEEPPSWFKKFLSEGLSEMDKNPKSDKAKQAASQIWNDRVVPKRQKVTPSSNYDTMFSQIFGK